MNFPYFTRVAILAALFAAPLSVTVLAHESDEKALAGQDQSAFKPYSGRIKGDSVRLRTGAGVNHPPIYVFEKSEEVTVVGLKDGWAQVKLPKNAPCWIATEFITAAPDGKSYTVKGDKVNLRGSADTNSFPIGQVKKDSVLSAVIDGQSGKAIVAEGYVRVVAPSEARAWVSAEFVEKLHDIAPEKLVEPKAEERKVDPKAVVEKPKAEETKSDAGGKGEVIPPKVEKKSDAAAPTKQQLDDEAKTFAELKDMLRDELKKPSEQVNLTNLRKMFEQYSEFALDEKLRGEAKTLIEKIDSTVNMIAAEKKRLADEQARREAEIERIKKEALEKKEPKEDLGPANYIVKGTVGETGKLAKTPASHRLFDDEGNVLYDLRWDKGDLASLKGKYVGITGEVKEYEGWPHKVIVIKRIDVLIEDDDK